MKKTLLLLSLALTACLAFGADFQTDLQVGFEEEEGYVWGEIVGQNGTYACFAVAEGADGYSSDPEKWIIKSPHPLKYYRLLFPVKQDEIAAAKKELLPVTLKVKLYETTLAPASFRVRVMPEGKNFTRVSSVRPEGICNMTYHEAFESGN